jgi:hypothetical protein
MKHLPLYLVMVIPCYSIISSSSVRKTALTHLGDVFSTLANASNAQGDNGTGGPANYRGPLGNISLIA